MTFSIAARCDRTGMFGMAVSSSSPAVAARCAHARAKVGVVATQNVTDPRLGPSGLDLLAQGFDAASVRDALERQAGDTAPYRQVLVVDKLGSPAVFSGERALGRFGHHVAPNVAAAGNMLADADIPRAMVDAFLARTNEHIAERLISALTDALSRGGEEGPVQSAGLLVVDEEDWPLIDLRVDWSDSPISALSGLWAIWEPQMHDYVRRGLNPSSAPSYGVPGDR